MSALVIDTSSWISYFGASAGETIIDSALADGRVWVPPVVAAELLSGRLTERARADLEGLLSTLPLCTCDLDHWFRVGRLRGLLAAKGIAASTPDVHVAQCALDLGAELLSGDAIFRHIARRTKLRLLA